MRTIFNETNRLDLIKRIRFISNDCTAQWGKMNVYQMLKHCIVWEEWIQGTNQIRYRQEFLGLIFGKMALKSMIKNDKPFKRNIPTSAQFQVTEKEGDMESDKEKWIALIQSYEHYSNPGFIHDFFGKMTKEQIGILAYKHTDHHLRQFNC